MKLINPNVEILEQGLGFEGMLKHIELCGRVAYKSEDKINDFSAEKFVDMIRKRKHTAVLEHGTIYLKTSEGGVANVFRRLPYTQVRSVYPEGDIPNIYCTPTYYITTNYRVIVKGKLEEYLKYQCVPTDYHPRRITARFTCDRGVSHEFVRHRVFSFVQESTRYCNYSKDKFGKECTFIIPSWLDLREGSYQHNEQSIIINFPQGGWVKYSMGKKYTFLRSLGIAEESYFQLLDNDYEETWIAQQARAVLPNSLKTELVMTGFVDEWKHFFNLRTNKDAHPQAKELADKLLDIFCDEEILCPCDIDHNIS